MATKTKVVLKTRVAKGSKRTTLTSKPGYDPTTMDIAAQIAALNAYFSSLGSGCMIESATTHLPVNVDISALNATARKGEATVIICDDEDGGVHKYRFGKLLDEHYVDDGENKNVVVTIGQQIADIIGYFTGFSMTFVRGYYDSDPV